MASLLPSPAPTPFQIIHSSTPQDTIPEIRLFLAEEGLSPYPERFRDPDQDLVDHVSQAHSVSASPHPRYTQLLQSSSSYLQGSQVCSPNPNLTRVSDTSEATHGLTNTPSTDESGPTPPHPTQADHPPIHYSSKKKRMDEEQVRNTIAEVEQLRKELAQAKQENVQLRTAAFGIDRSESSVDSISNEDQDKVLSIADLQAKFNQTSIPGSAPGSGAYRIDLMSNPNLSSIWSTNSHSDTSTKAVNNSHAYSTLPPQRSQGYTPVQGLFSSASSAVDQSAKGDDHGSTFYGQPTPESGSSTHFPKSATGSVFPQSAKQTNFLMPQCDSNVYLANDTYANMPMSAGPSPPKASYGGLSSSTLPRNFHAQGHGLGNGAGVGGRGSFVYGMTPPSTGHLSGRNGFSSSSIQGPHAQRSSRLSPMAHDFQPIAFSTSASFASKTGMSASQASAVVQAVNSQSLLNTANRGDFTGLVHRVCYENDQQASLFLQQRVRSAREEERAAICQAIANDTDRLTPNRFGNFLVQRALEYGTPAQVLQIAQLLGGKVVRFSKDPFACHVVQKAFDYVPYQQKVSMVMELLQDIHATIIHRYACHVWQKLFEINWADGENPPQIMDTVNGTVAGMWHEVAMGETGSLVVQNIFENCLEADKRQCIEEVFHHFDIIACSQFGNWCIQHLCEHGNEQDRTRALDHVLSNAYRFSVEQYASKVIEKCLKVLGDPFIDAYLDNVCTQDPSRARVPLVDTQDQYGNYLVQHILHHASERNRDRVIQALRRYMVTLRGSKYGQRVAMACTTNNTVRTSISSTLREQSLPDPTNFGHFPSRGGHGARGSRHPFA